MFNININRLNIEEKLRKPLKRSPWSDRAKYGFLFTRPNSTAY